MALLCRPSISALRPLPGVIRTLSRHRRMTESDPTGHRIAESLKTCESKAARKDGYASMVPFTGSRLNIPAR
jgi:hypothetical protein